MLKFMHLRFSVVWRAAPWVLAVMAATAGAAPESAMPGNDAVKPADCQSVAMNANTEQSSRKKIDPIHVGATGYGAPPPKYYPENQRRLLAMRASKIDAYRALAETVNGLRIRGGTTVGDMVVQQDRYRVFVDAYVRGARILSVTANDDGNYETTVELLVDENFLAKILTQPTTPPCGGEDAHISFAPPESPSTFYYSE
mgnify:CR=1 FL=1